MAIAFRDKASAKVNVGTTVTVANSGEVPDGDIIVAHCCAEVVGLVITADTGVWTEFAAPGTQSTMTMKSFYRTASAEPDNWVFSHDGVAQDFCVVIGMYFNDAGIGTWTLEAEQHSQGTGINTLTTTSILGAASSLYVLGCANDDDETITTEPVGPTKLFEYGGLGAPAPPDGGRLPSTSLASWFELVGAGGIVDAITWGGGVEEIISQAGIFTNDASAGAVTVINVNGAPFSNGVAAAIKGAGFEALKGTGSVKISPTDNVGDAGAVTQTDTGWTDTEVNFTLVKGGLSLDTNVFVFVVNDSAASNAAGFVIQIVPEYILDFAQEVGVIFNMTFEIIPPPPINPVADLNRAHPWFYPRW